MLPGHDSNLMPRRQLMLVQNLVVDRFRVVQGPRYTGVTILDLSVINQRSSVPRFPHSYRRPLALARAHTHPVLASLKRLREVVKLYNTDKYHFASNKAFRRFRIIPDRSQSSNM